MNEKTALITGASSGIGRELARIHASNGGDLVLVGRDSNRLNQVKQELTSKYHIQVMTIVKDLTEEHAARDIYNEVKNANITIEYLINNAGIGGHGIFYERSFEEDRAMIQTNVIALTELTRLYLPDFVKRNHGRILNLSSTASLMPGPLQAVYFASKSYVSFLSFALVKELDHTNVTVTALLPGATNTRFAERASMQNSKLMKHQVQPDKVAKVGYRAMMKGKRKVMSGVPLWQRISFVFMPFIPMKTILNMTYNMQSDK